MTFPINLIFTIHTNNNEKYNDLPEGLILYPTIFLMHELPIITTMILLSMLTIIK